MMFPGFGGPQVGAGLLEGNLVGLARITSWRGTARKAGAAFVAVGIDTDVTATRAARRRVEHCMSKIECVIKLHQFVRLRIAPVNMEDLTASSFLGNR
jgi:hypothetical protein